MPQARPKKSVHATRHAMLAKLLPFAFPIAAVPFASVHDVPLIVAGVVPACVTAAALWTAHTTGKLRTQTSVLYLVAALPILLGLLQLWPMEEGLRNVLQPGYEPLAKTSMSFIGADLRVLSLNPRQTAIEICFNIGMISLALLSTVLLSSVHRAKRAAAVIATCAAVISAVGIAQIATGSAEILWFFSSPEWRQPFATFINNNHGSVAVAACVPFGLYLSARSRDQTEFWVWSSLTLLIAVGAVTSGSRSGAIILLVSTLTYLLTQSSSRPRYLGLFVLAASALGIAFLGFESGFLALTFAIEPDFYLPGGLDTGRANVYRAALPLLWSAPLIGAGAGAFSEAFKSRHLVEVGGTVQQAHSDPIEIGIEYGLVSLSLWSIIGLIVVAHLAQTCWKSRDSRKVNLIAANLGCAIGILVHSAWDFPLRIGAIAVLFALAIGAAWGLTKHDSAVPSSGMTQFIRVTGGALALCSLVLGSIAIGQERNPASLYGASEYTLEQAKSAMESGNLEEAERLYLLALAQRPFEHRALLNLAAIEQQRNNPVQAIEILESAARIFPDNHYIWLNLARIHRAQGRSLQAAQHYRTLLALRSPTEKLAGEWLVEALSNHPAPHTVADIILPGRPERWCAAAGIVTREHGIEAGEAMYKLAGDLDPDCDYTYAANLHTWKRSEEGLDLLSTLPKNCISLRTSGIILLALNRMADAAATLGQAATQCTLDPYARFQLGVAQYENNNSNGLRILRQLILDHDEPHVRQALMFRLEESGETKEAVQHLEILLQRNSIRPEDIDSRRYPRLYHLSKRP